MQDFQQQTIRGRVDVPPSAVAEVIDFMPRKMDVDVGVDVAIQIFPRSEWAKLVGVRSLNEKGEVLITRISTNPHVSCALPKEGMDASHYAIRGPGFAHECFDASELGFISRDMPMVVVFQAQKPDARLKLVVFWLPSQAVDCPFCQQRLPVFEPDSALEVVARHVVAVCPKGRCEMT